MAIATKYPETEVQASLLGLDLYMVKIGLGGTESDATTLDTGFRSVVHAQATWADGDPGSTTSSLSLSISGGVITVNASVDVGTATPLSDVWVLAFGYRG